MRLLFVMESKVVYFGIFLTTNFNTKPLQMAASGLQLLRKVATKPVLMRYNGPNLVTPS